VGDDATWRPRDGDGGLESLDLRIVEEDTPAGSPRDRRSRLVTVASFGVAVVAATLAIEITLAADRTHPAPQNPARAALTALAAAGRVGSFHYVATWQVDGASQTVSGDASPSSGTQHVRAGDAEYSVALEQGTVYFDGDASALEDQLGVSAQTAERYAGSWISLTQSDEPYAALEGGVTAASALGQILIEPTSISTFRVPHHTPVARIIGYIPPGRPGQVLTGAAVLDTTTRSGLPALYRVTGSDGGVGWQSEIMFSRWGQPVAVSAPSGAHPYTSLLAGHAAQDTSSS
jgi:hypothetical protein